VAVDIGIDLVAVAEVEEAIARHGERYLRRVYTDSELRDCRGRASWLAARFAAKEAVTKALRADRALGWQSISVELNERSRPAIVLAGEALALARLRGVAACTVDLWVDRRRALALVLAQTGSGEL
jgi:holo-[acyl-carrier protein] synthase